jgi:hypothetical protein
MEALNQVPDANGPTNPKQGAVAGENGRGGTFIWIMLIKSSKVPHRMDKEE